jgi:hypothetical protein
VSHSNIHLLNSNDFFFDSWDESDIGQHAVWDNMKTWLFETTTCYKRLDHEIVALVLAAQCVYQDIGLSGMIVNLELIILD